MMTNFLKYLEVFQVCDSTFPIGTFNHSFGMENYLSERRIKKSPEFNIWLRNYYKTQFKYGEGLLIKLTYEALKEDNFQLILELDHAMEAATIARETRMGTRLIAQQMLSLLKEIHGKEVTFLNDYQAEVKTKKAHGNPAIAFALFAYYKGIPLQDAFMMYGYSVASTLVQNAVRAVPLGQKSGQLILKTIVEELSVIYEQISYLGLAYLGANAPGIELSQMKHETQEARLFMS
ncbi:urease accessory protein UreF [Lactococcus lactis]|uniref:urease accessory protein UreF n=1 Tax=Lactococcus lactis TaxID=1358 RepID=UPI00117B94DD|nr:urease accessory protein UreF [Lactococcus lactis]TRW74416.1 urease accessory protein UreF [Lactococcus lactis]